MRRVAKGGSDRQSASSGASIMGVGVRSGRDEPVSLANSEEFTSGVGKESCFV